MGFQILFQNEKNSILVDDHHFNIIVSHVTQVIVGDLSCVSMLGQLKEISLGDHFVNNLHNAMVMVENVGKKILWDFAGTINFPVTFL